MSAGHGEYFKIGEKGHSILGGQGGAGNLKGLCFHGEFYSLCVCGWE